MLSAAPRCEDPRSPARSSLAGESSPGEPCRSWSRSLNLCSNPRIVWQTRTPKISGFPPKLVVVGPVRSQRTQLRFGSSDSALSLCCFAKRHLFVFACGDKGFPSTGANLFYLLPAPNSPQICVLRSAPDSARTSMAISLSVLLFAMEIKLIRKGKGKTDLSACLALTQSGWKGAGLK